MWRCIICGSLAKNLSNWNRGKTPLCKSKACARKRKTDLQRKRRAQLLLRLGA